MSVLIPLLTLVVPAGLGYYGMRGVLYQRAISGFRLDGRIYMSEVTGGPAIVLGVLQLLLGVALLVILAPLSAALLGLW